jgi:Glycosyltransferase family 87
MTIASGPARAGRRVMGLLQLAGLALLVLYLVTFFAGNVHLQWDFKVYLAAGRAARAGLDPYAMSDLGKAAGHAVAFPFLYPPISLLLWIPLAALPAGAALTTWMAFKTALLVGLVVLWKRVFVPRAAWFALTLTALFGWNGAALWDLRAGNVAILETALLWAAFTCFVTRRRTAFTVLVVTAACFKLLPAAFLLLLLVPLDDARSEPRRFAIGGIAVAALTLGPLLAGPAAGWSGFLRHVPLAHMAGDANPSLPAALTTLALGFGFSDATAMRIAEMAWPFCVLLLIAVSLPHLRRLWIERDARRWVASAACLYVLVAPRPMAYGFLLLAPVPLFFSPAPFDRPAGQMLLALVLSAQGLARAAHQPVETPLVVYSPLLLTFAIWMLIVYGRAARGESATSARPAAAAARSG